MTLSRGCNPSVRWSEKALASQSSSGWRVRFSKGKTATRVFPAVTSPIAAPGASDL